MTSPRLELLRLEAAMWRPLERLSPSAFAERHRFLKKGAGWVDGPWRNKHAPYLRDVMDAVAECLRRGIRLLVLMKSAQGGGTDALGVNAVLWWLTYLGGSVLYITAKDELAEQVALDRWSGPEGAIAKCAPVAAKHLAGKRHHEKIQIKRFTDAKLSFCGSQSVLNFQSNPYVLVELDEVDSIARAMTDGSDPVELANQRVSAMAEGRPVLVIAFAHPSSPEGHVTQLYRTLSDQRRGHVQCPHCAEWIAPRWEHVRAIARAGQSPAEAERDPSCYVYSCPSCGAMWSDADRLRAVRVVPQRSTLPPEVAATKRAIGLHFWKFFMLSKPIVELAEEYVRAFDDPPKMRVFVNKTLGEPFEERVHEVSPDTWRKLALPEGEAGSYSLGEVPEGVQFLTAGQDSGKRELHWAVWGWGLTRAEGGAVVLRGWLLDYGVEPGPASEDPDRGTLHVEDLRVFDQVLYQRTWPSARGGDVDFYLLQGFHDAKWQRIAVVEYCAGLDGQAVPAWGLPTDDRSRQEPVSFGKPFQSVVGDETLVYENVRLAKLNTYVLKLDFLGIAGKRFVDEKKVPRPRLTLPRDVEPRFLDALSSEKLVLEDGRRFWTKTSHANHWWDCSIYAYAAALNLAPQEPSSIVEIEERRPRPRGPGAIRTDYS